MKNLLADLFYETAVLYPNKTAIWCDSQTLTYESFSNLVSQYSNFLLHHGVCYGDHIGIPMNNSIESAALIFTAANLGLTLVPINPTLPINAIKKAFFAANVKHIIARNNFFEEYHNFLEIDGLQISLDLEKSNSKFLSLSDVTQFSIKRPIVSQVTGEEEFIITMTSGSTGSPKPISLTQNNKYQRAMAHIALYHITKDDNILAATPLYHSLAERLVIIPLLIGGSSILLSRFTPNLWLNCVKDTNVTFTIAVSAQLSQIASLLSSPSVPKVNSLRCVVSSSALLEPCIKDELIDKLQCEFHEMYGTSETSTITNINFKEAMEYKHSLGKPLPQASIQIIDENGAILEFGEIGEIICKTSLLCNGYYGIPETFEKALHNGYFKTGDMGYLTEDGFLYFSGRKKEIIITGGINVYPLDIETCILKLPEVKECAAFSYPDERLGEIVALAIVLYSDQVLTKHQIQIYCAKNLADFQQPHKIFFLTKLPKNSMNKLIKSEIIKYIQLYSIN